MDGVDARLDKAGELGAVPVDYRRGDPVEQIRELRARSGLPIGEEKLGGVDKVIDAVGIRARDRAHPDRERPGRRATSTSSTPLPGETASHTFTDSTGPAG